MKEAVNKNKLGMLNTKLFQTTWIKIVVTDNGRGIQSLEKQYHVSSDSYIP